MFCYTVAIDFEVDDKYSIPCVDRTSMPTSPSSHGF